MLTLLSTWFTTMFLIFGGCCSNAITLEQLTLQHPNSGSVLTFFQFLLISLHGLPKFIIWTPYGPRFRPRRVPITHYLIQVVLFYLVSLLNNAAFAYRIPMAVHIIFRSGGLIVSMFIGWLVSNKRYTLTQITSVILITIGVIITTLSASEPHSSSAASPINPYTYASGIGILTLALILSGFLGLVQDWTYSQYIRPSLPSPKQNDVVTSIKEPESLPWQESMFYLHFLALPMLVPLLPNLAAQMDQLNTIGPRANFSFPLSIPASMNTTSFPPSIILLQSLPPLPIHLFPQSGNLSLLSISQSLPKSNLSTDLYDYPLSVSLSIPHIYLPLVLNTITQLVCVAGVHRLTTRVSALTVTLVLVVRKAISLIISVVGITHVGHVIRGFAFLASEKICGVLGLDGSMFDWSLWNIFRLDLDAMFSSLGVALVGPGEGKQSQEVDTRLMWTGAALVLVGTIGYAIGTRPREVKDQEKAKKE
ncbi:UAA transporter [Phlegmacium glaucopus]|nr:UAA transporter [Phlegmacium glaucopus]